MRLKQRLVEIRRQKGLSQREVGEAVGLSRVSLSHYELGKSAPQVFNLICIADYYQVSLDYLVGREWPE